MTFVNKPSIFINSTFPPYKIDETTKASDKIGSIWNEFKKCKNATETVDLMGLLGVDRRDQEAHAILLPIIQGAFKGLEVIASKNDSGVFFLSLNGKKIAVFKVGEKRARMELLARSIAFQTGLEKYAIAGIACSIQYPKFPREEVQVEMFNGNVKAFRSSGDGNYNHALRKQNEGLEKPYTITGILEPFIQKSPEITKEEFLEMVTFALIIGLRDGKTSGRKGYVLFDLEDCMPERFIANITPDRTVAATHLPLLEHELASQKIPVQVLQKLAEKVKDGPIPILNILARLRNETVEIADLAGESLQAVDDEIDWGKKNKRPMHDIGWDDGGCPVQVEASELIMEQHPTIQVESQKTRLLTEKQLESFADRISRLREALENNIKIGKSMTAIELVCAVDPFYRTQLDSLRRAGFDREPYYHIIGRHTPLATGIRFSADELESLRKSTNAVKSLSSNPELTNENQQEVQKHSVSSSESPRSLDSIHPRAISKRTFLLGREKN